MEDHSSLLCLRTNSMIESVVQVNLKKINFFYIFKLFLCINTKINLFFFNIKSISSSNN